MWCDVCQFIYRASLSLSASLWWWWWTFELLKVLNELGQGPVGGGHENDVVVETRRGGVSQ